MGNRFVLKPDVEGIRLDIFLSEKLSIARSKTKTMIEMGYVKVWGKTTKPSLKVKKDMIIEGEVPSQPSILVEPQEIPLHILYEDEYLLFINKPSGMVVHPSFGHKNGTLVNALIAYLDKNHIRMNTQEIRPGIVHRLDKDTTGVILVAKNSDAQETLSRMFKERKIKKIYRAIVWGNLDQKEGKIEGKIGRHPKDRKRMTVLKEGGRDALTEYTTISKMIGFTYVEIYPYTGRTHQIRVHFSHIGHPIVGDTVYGKRAKNLAERPLLHALKLEFVHPYTGKFISVFAPEPTDMRSFIEAHSGKKK
ncbi:MAG: RluA family pseudouridine synthase [Deltaproteobacteria bacterium]|nr:RluA family pseudouridine synthase [Deltaproteobacteria bacterium]